MSFDQAPVESSVKIIRLNPFRAGRCLSTFAPYVINRTVEKSQSLSSRAMSFDKQEFKIRGLDNCLNPFRAGRCLST